jgi:hypothetical protein
VSSPLSVGGLICVMEFSFTWRHVHWTIWLIFWFSFCESLLKWKWIEIQKSCILSVQSLWKLWVTVTSNKWNCLLCYCRNAFQWVKQRMNEGIPLA